MPTHHLWRGEKASKAEDIYWKGVTITDEIGTRVFEIFLLKSLQFCWPPLVTCLFASLLCFSGNPYPASRLSFHLFNQGSFVYPCNLLHPALPFRLSLKAYPASRQINVGPAMYTPTFYCCTSTVMHVDSQSYLRGLRNNDQVAAIWCEI